MWTDAPIPADQIIAGEPVARSCKLHEAREGGLVMHYWDCTAGDFTWYYGGDELVQVLEGEVHITDEAGETSVLREGDTAHFVAGTTLTWHVPRYVRKLAINRSAQTLPDRVLLKLTRIFTGRPERAAAALAAVGTAVAVPVVAVL